MKRRVRLSEAQLHSVINKAVNRVLKEDSINAGDKSWIFDQCRIYVRNERKLYDTYHMFVDNIARKIKRRMEIIPEKLAYCRSMKNLISELFKLIDIPVRYHKEEFKEACMMIAKDIIYDAEDKVQGESNIDNAVKESIRRIVSEEVYDRWSRKIKCGNGISRGHSDGKTNGVKPGGSRVDGQPSGRPKNPATLEAGVCQGRIEKNMLDEDSKKKEKNKKKEKDEHFSSQVRRMLRQDKINLASVARKVFPDVDEDSARSMVSKISRGKLKASNNTFLKIYQYINSGQGVKD